MSDKKRKVPKLRFPGFTDAWEQRKLGEVVFRRNTAEVTGALPGVEYEDVIPEEGRLNKDVSLKEVTKKGLEFLEGDVLFGKLRPYLKNWLFAEFNGVAVGDWWVLYSDKVDGRLIYYLIQTDSYQTVANLSTGTKMPRSDWATVSQTSFSFPVEANEQLKIGKHFSSIDSLISLHQRKLDNVKMLKKSLLQKSFPKDGEKTPELRFPGFTDAWEQRKLGEVTEKFDNLRIPIAAQLRASGPTPYYGANGIQDYVDGFTHDGEFILLAEDGANNIYDYPVHYVNGKIWVNNHAHVLQAKEGTADNLFLLVSLKSINMEPYLVGGGRAKLNADVMMKLPIGVPSNQEQVILGRFFNTLNSLISLHQRKLDHLKELKKGLLQQMFV